MSISPEEAPTEDYGSEDINPPDRSRKTQAGSRQALPEEFAVGADCESRIRSGAEEVGGDFNVESIGPKKL